MSRARTIRRRSCGQSASVGELRVDRAIAIDERLATLRANTNRDGLPKEAWQTIVRPAMAAAGITTRALHAGVGNAYCGSTLYRSGLSRERAARVAEIVGSDELRSLAASDVFWDRVVSIEPDGEEDVYDLTVDGLHNFVAEDIVVHNSIEQDADLVPSSTATSTTTRSPISRGSPR